MTSFWSPEAHNMPPRGALMPILGIIEPPISDVTFLMNFGSHQGLPGGAVRRGRVTSPPVCFSTFWLITVISPCVFDVFRITGFRYRWRERFPLEIYLSQRESRRSIPEERPGIEEPHASRASGHGGGYIYIYIYIYVMINEIVRLWLHFFIE